MVKAGEVSVYLKLMGFPATVNGMVVVESKVRHPIRKGFAFASFWFVGRYVVPFVKII